jgi:hypothetical protein
MIRMAKNRTIVGFFAESEFLQPRRGSIPTAAKADFCAPIGGN